ncbi:hypothetical protein EG329_005741 [Mollisiaceae sp. DMI_Dod_QoI]|nr:hypothetical protein EG329_005741 [Helotiales sp. DMI_Dod_QoI]
MDSCYCQTDLQAAAVKTISKCVMSLCTIGDSQADVTSAENVYNGYCSAAGFTANTAVVVASTIAAGARQVLTNKYRYMSHVIEQYIFIFHFRDLVKQFIRPQQEYDDRYHYSYLVDEAEEEDA